MQTVNMADKAKQDMIDNFIKITGVDQDRARFYMESSAWNLELAMASFYEGDPDDDNDLVGGMVGSGVPQQQPQAPPEPLAGGRKPKSTGASSSRFATIGSMQGQDEDSSDEDGQAFYAGGSERSGQQVLGPKKKKTHVAEDLFKSAKDHGAEEVNSAEPPRPGGSKAKVFKGSGYRLGDGEGQDSERISGEPVAQSRKQVDCVLKLWKDGFSVDDGPLRDFKDPANKEFLASISKGEIPHELIQGARGGEVSLNMEDHRTEDYVKPKVPVRAFTGEGNVLGSPAPTVVSATSKSSSSAPGSNQSTIKVDESQPVTTIQLRLADGSRLVSKFNHSHTVGDIRRHITSSRPQYEGVNFILQTTFPNRELSNTSETVEQAKLQNAVVMQRLT